MPRRGNGPLPLSARVKDFSHLSADEIRLLTPAARLLTKKDLLLLAGEEFTPATRRLRVEDLHSLQEVFGKNSLKLATKGGGFYCCCCCCALCCCCSAASVRPANVGFLFVGPEPGPEKHPKGSSRLTFSS
jgi:hypothetical protein